MFRTVNTNRTSIVRFASIAAAVLLLGGLYVGLRHWSNNDAGQIPESASFHLLLPRKADETVRFEDLPVFRIAQGGTFTLFVHSERPGVIHIHGYDKEVILVPGSDVTITFVATNAGRFPIHLHDANGTMHHKATLEVLPR
jgi:hypothetical protein